MKNRHWRELLEIVGIVSIVAALLLLAAEIRHSNRIGAAQAELQLAQAFDALHIVRSSDPDFAKLFPKLEAPQAHLTTATDTSQIRGIAWHYVTAMRSVQRAFQNGLISGDVRDAYIVDFAYTLEQWPGLRSHYVYLYENLESMQDVKIFSPIAEYLATQAVDPESN